MEGNNRIECIEQLLMEIEESLTISEEVKIPSLFVVCEDKDIAYECGKRYSSILDKAGYFQEIGRGTFINLVFPKDNEKDEKLFFASPRRVAATRNRFWGTMCISLEEFEGKDLTKSKSYHELLNFIKNNKENIQFLIHVLPEFTMKRQLYVDLASITGFKLLQASSAKDKRQSIREEFEQHGFYCDEDVVSSVDHILSDKDHVVQLDALIDRIKFEMTLGDGLYPIQDVLSKIEKEYSDEIISDDHIKMGFRP